MLARLFRREPAPGRFETGSASSRRGYVATAPARRGHARLPGLRAAWVDAMEARVASRHVPWLQPDAGAIRRAHRHRRARRPRRHAGAVAATGERRQSVGLLELVRGEYRARWRRSGDRRGADRRRASPLSRAARACLGGWHLRRRRARGGTRAALSATRARHSRAFRVGVRRGEISGNRVVRDARWSRQRRASHRRRRAKRRSPTRCSLCLVGSSRMPHPGKPPRDTSGDLRQDFVPKARPFCSSTRWRAARCRSPITPA